MLRTNRIVHNLTIWEYLGCTKEQVQQIVGDISSYYTSHRIEKRSGSFRRIDAPKHPLSIIQGNILHKILYLYKPHPIAHGFIKQRGSKTNALAHVGKKFVGTIDIKDFFPSIKEDRVLALLKFFIPKQYIFDIEESDYTLLAQLVCYKQHLPQGAPTSPAISNLICLHMDGELLKLAKELQCTVTRYADDITMSCLEKPENPKELLTRFKTIIKIHGFKINNQKVRYRHYWSRQLVNGIIVNSKLGVPKEYWRNLRAEIHNLLTSTELIVTPIYLQQLRGRIEWVRQLNSFRGNQLTRQLQEALASPRTAQ